MSSTIQLIHLGKVCQSRQYDCPAEKNRIIKTWKKIYGRGYGNTTLNDIPSMRQRQAEKKEKSRFGKGDIPKIYNSSKKLHSVVRKDITIHGKY